MACLSGGHCLAGRGASPAGGHLGELVPHLHWPDTFGWMYCFSLCLPLGSASHCHNGPDEAVKTDRRTKQSRGHGLSRAWGLPCLCFHPENCSSLLKKSPFPPCFWEDFGDIYSSSCFSFSGVEKPGMPGLAQELRSWVGSPGMSQ